MKHQTKRYQHISPQTDEVAERYGLGRPLAEYRLRFSRQEVVSLMRSLFSLILLVIVAVLLIKNFSILSHREDGRELLLALVGGTLFIFWLVDVRGIVRYLQDLSQQRTSLLVCQEGLLYFHDGRAEVVPWQQIQRYVLTRPGISRQITIYRPDGRPFQIDDRLDNFGNFLWRLTSQLMTRKPMREETFLPLPKAFRLHPNSRKRWYLLLGGFAIGEGILWMISLSDPPLLVPTFGILQFFIAWALCVALVMLWLRQRLVSKLQIVLSQEGIVYDSPGYSIYTPWQNIVDVEDVSSRALFGLRLRVPARQGMTVKDGQEQGIAVLERHRRGLTGKRFRKSSPLVDVFPLDASLVGSRWLQGEFAQYLRIYAPQMCDEDG